MSPALLERPPAARAAARAHPEASPAGGTRIRLPTEPALDGIRGLAVAGVLLFHAGFSWAVGGFLGVSTFFTLSGFLITSLLVRERMATGTVRLRSFWARRFRRLMPAALLALGLVVIYGIFAATPDQLRALRGDVLSALGYVANWHFVFSGQSYAHLFASPSPVEHFWSLAIEEQFYLLFPLLTFGVLWLTRGSRKDLGRVYGALAITSLALTLLLYHPGGDTGRVYYGTDTRALELLAGSLLAVVMAKRFELRRLIPRMLVVALGTGALVFTIVVWVTVDQGEHWLYQGGLALYALGSAALIAAAVQPGPVRAVLSVSPLRWLGRISYGVYLYHWPVFLWLSPQRTGLPPWPLFGLRLAVTLAIATVSFHTVEQPVRSGRRLVSWRPLVVAPAAALTLVVALVLVTTSPPKPAISFAAPAPPPLPQRSSGAGLPVSTAPVPSSLPSSTGAPAPRAAPPSLAPGEAPRVMVAGDSEAFEVGVGLAVWGKATGRLQVWDGGKFGCGLVPGGALRFKGKTQSQDDCKDWPTYWADQLAQVQPHVVMVMTGVWDTADRLLSGDTKWRALGDKQYDALIESRMIADIDFLSSQGATVVWLTSPYIEPGAEQGDTGPWPEAGHKRMDRLNELARAAVAARPDRARIVDLVAHLRDRPQGELDLNERPDGIHFSDAASGTLAKTWLGPTLEAIPQP